MCILRGHTPPPTNPNLNLNLRVRRTAVKPANHIVGLSSNFWDSANATRERHELRSEHSLCGITLERCVRGNTNKFHKNLKNCFALQATLITVSSAITRVSLMRTGYNTIDGKAKAVCNTRTFRYVWLLLRDFSDQCEDRRMEDGPHFFWSDPIFYKIFYNVRYRVIAEVTVLLAWGVPRIRQYKCNSRSTTQTFAQLKVPVCIADRTWNKAGNIPIT